MKNMPAYQYVISGVYSAPARRSYISCFSENFAWSMHMSLAGTPGKNFDLVYREFLELESMDLDL